MNNCFFNMSKSMFYTTLETMLIHHWLFLVSLIYSNFCSFNTSCSLKSRNLNYRTSKFLLHCINVDFVSILFNNIHHVNCNYHWNTKFCKLSCKIKVSFKVSSINNIQNCIWTFFYKIVTRNNFFQSIRRKRINTW